MSYSETAALNAIFGILGTFWLLVVAYFVISIIANWKIFTKAGQPGWAAIVPFYKQYIEFKIYWGNGWLFLVPIVLAALAFVPLLGQLLILANLVITIVTQYKKAVSFGQGVGFTIGLVLVNPIFNMILGFGQYQYLGVPQDGYSYDQLKNKYDERKATAANTQTVYTQPPQDYQPNQNVSYQNPNTQSQYQQPQQPVYPQQSYQQAPQQPTSPQQAPVQPQDSNGMSQPKPPVQNGQ